MNEWQSSKMSGWNWDSITVLKKGGGFFLRIMGKNEETEKMRINMLYMN